MISISWARMPFSCEASTACAALCTSRSTTCLCVQPRPYAWPNQRWLSTHAFTSLPTSFHSFVVSSDTGRLAETIYTLRLNVQMQPTLIWAQGPERLRRFQVWLFWRAAENASGLNARV